MSKKYSQGPWTWENVAGSGLQIKADVAATMGIDFTKVVNIFEMHTYQPPRFQIAFERWVQFPKREWDEMQEANARLMAAAPDLLHAVEQARDLLATKGVDVKLLDDVIKKAVGEEE